MATPADMTRFGRFTGAVEAAAKKISPVTYVDADSAKFLLIHAQGDGLVPYEQSELLVEKLKAAKVPVKLLPVAGGNHAFWNGRGAVAAKALADATAFFEETLKASPTTKSRRNRARPNVAAVRYSIKNHVKPSASIFTGMSTV